MLKNYASIKDILLLRATHHPSDTMDYTTADLEGGYMHAPITVAIKTTDESKNSHFNRFTDNNKPYAILKRSLSFSHQNPGEMIIGLFGLQVSPNYHGNSSTPGVQKVFWKYNSTMKAIFSDPTKITQPRVGLVFNSDPYDDSSYPYPIPMEYVKELIERVLQVEMQTVLKTLPDSVDDNTDTTKKMTSRGPQVQR